jgi:hypothetical protein
VAHAVQRGMTSNDGAEQSSTFGTALYFCIIQMVVNVNDNMDPQTAEHALTAQPCNVWLIAMFCKIK